MANLIKNGEGTTLTDWSNTNTTIDNGFKISAGGIAQTIVITDANRSTKYKLSYNAKELRDNKSYFLLTVSLVTGGYNTCFVPIQFSGLAEIPLTISADAQTIIFEVVGNLTISNLVMDIDSELTPQDKLNLLKVSENGAKWDKVIEFTSATGKLNADMLEGLINTTLNRFTNTSGTIIQENGETLYLNGTTVANSTAAMKLGSTGLLIADSKNTDGTWKWATAVTGAGISATAIVTGILSAITISGVNIVSSSTTSTTITGAIMENNILYSGDRTTGNYMKIDGGLITVYKANKRVFVVNSDGAVDMWAEDEVQWLSIKPKDTFNSKNYSTIKISGGTQGLRLLTGNSSITMDYDGTIAIAGNTLTFNGASLG